jgi:PAS domain S-box-containing protein
LRKNILGEEIRILILEDVSTDADLEEFELQEAGLAFTSKRVTTEKEYIRELHHFSPHLILSDYDLPQYNGALALADAKRECPDIPFILVTGALGEDRAIEILTQGAKDYVLKSRLNRLVPAVQRALEEAEAHKARRKAEDALREAHRALENQVEERTAELRAEIAFRKQTEESLRRSEENLRLALEASGQGIWDWNLLTGELTWSDKCRAIFGLKADAVITYDIFQQLVHPDDRERINQAVSQALERREDYDVEMRILWSDGTLRWVASKGRGLYNGENKPLRMIGVTRDITERRQLENDLTNARKLEAVGTLAGGIAHDFNNLLAVIQGQIDLVWMGVSPESRVSDALKAAGGVIQQATELTNRLITFARGGQPIRKLCDVREMIKDTVDRMVAGLPLDTTYFIDDDLRPVEVDERQLRQVIRNLVVNAIEAMPTGGSLRIGAKNVKVSGLDLLPVPEGDYIRICVADSGIGISERDLTHIFDPYFSTKQMGAQKGMGLGLSVCYSIVSSHQGCITVDSQKEEGSSFYVYLPLLIREVPAQLVTPKENQGKSESSRKVLVMDDEAMVREVTRDLLAASGYDVETTADGLDAVNLYIRAKESSNPFAAVILDLSVKSGLGGLPTLKKLLEIDPQVKGIISSGHSDHPVIHNFRQYGFIGAVTKPFTREKLISIIEKLI